MDNPYVLVIVMSSLVIISFAFTQIARRTRIPSVLMLMGLGVAISSFSDSVGFDPDGIRGPLDVIGVVGLMLIVLEGALDLKLSKDRITMIRNSFLASLFILILTTLGITAIFYYMLECSFIQAFVNAIPLSVVSSAIVIPSVFSLFPAKKEFLIYESTFSDILGIMLFDFIAFEPPGKGIASGIPAGVSVGVLTILSIVLALGIAVVLVIVLNRITTHIKLFLFMSILALILAIGKLTHLPTLLAIFFFGIIVNNGDVVFRGWLEKFVDKGEFKFIREEFHTIAIETSFLVRTFFFVFFGMTLDLAALGNSEVLITGGLILLVIFGVRYLNLRLLVKSSVMPQLLIAPRGLVTVLLYYKIPPEYRIPGFDEGVLVLIILATSFLMMGGLLMSGKREEDLEGMAEVPEQSLEATIEGQEAVMDAQGSALEGAGGVVPPGEGDG